MYAPVGEVAIPPWLPHRYTPVGYSNSVASKVKIHTVAPTNGGVLMFNLYQHRRYPEYSLIAPHDSTPDGIKDEWALLETAISIVAG
jgi:hypothetical protein